MLTETNFHHRNTGSIIPPHRIHYAPYQHSTYPNKSLPQPATSDLQSPAKFDLHQAVRNNDVSGIVRLHTRLQQQPPVAETCLLDSNGHTPLYTAIVSGRLAMVDLLLRFGHNPVSSGSVESKLERGSLLVLHLGGTRISVESGDRLRSSGYNQLSARTWFSRWLSWLWK